MIEKFQLRKIEPQSQSTPRFKIEYSSAAEPQNIDLLSTTEILAKKKKRVQQRLSGEVREGAVWLPDG